MTRLINHCHCIFMVFCWHPLFWLPGVIPAPFICSLEFGDLSSYVSNIPFVNNLEADIGKPDSIMFSSWSSIWTYHTTSENLTHIVNRIDINHNRKNFNSLTNFAQKNSSTIILVDYGDSCLRKLNRFSKKVSAFVGRCGHTGFRDGLGEKAKFNSPYQVIIDPEDREQFIVTDQGNNALRRISIVSPTPLSTILSNLPTAPTAIAWHPQKHRTVFVTCECVVAEVNLISHRLVAHESACTLQSSILWLTNEVLLLTNDGMDGITVSGHFLAVFWTFLFLLSRIAWWQSLKPMMHTACTP